MFSKKAFPYVISFWTAFLLVIIMSTVMSLINTGTIHFPDHLYNIALGTVVAYIAGLVVPIAKWANAFAGMFKAKPGTIPFSLLSNVVYTVFFGILMTVLFTALAIGFPPYFLQACLGGLPLGFLVGYIAGCIVSPIALRLTIIMCSKNV